jgi:hypothetical protein
MYGSLMGSSLPSKDDSLWLWLAAIFFGLWHVRRSATQIDANGHRNVHCAVALLCFDGRVLWYNVVQKDAKGWMRLDRGVAGASLGIVCLFVCLQLARAVFDGFSQVEVRTRVHAPSRAFHSDCVRITLDVSHRAYCKM